MHDSAFEFGEELKNRIGFCCIKLKPDDFCHF